MRSSIHKNSYTFFVKKKLIFEIRLFITYFSGFMFQSYLLNKVVGCPLEMDLNSKLHKPVFPLPKSDMTYVFVMMNLSFI